jgi:putative N6-adenine-specific DNA methylase
VTASRRPLSYFAPCPTGLEQALAGELAELGAAAPRPLAGGVSFDGDLALGYRANLWSRIASRVLLRLAAAPYRNEQDVYEAARALDWPAWFSPQRTFKVAVAAARCPLTSLDFVTLRIKDAVADRFRDAAGARPDVDTRQPDVRVHAFLDAERVTLYLDLSGEALFKRGYRQQTGEAPLRENLAAGILRLSGWTAATALLDPLCGSGTIAVEAAMAALRIAPGRTRRFAFERLAIHEPTLWRRLREEAQEPAADAAPVIHASDIDPRAVAMARANARAAGVGDAVKVERRDALEVEPPATAGVIVTNPPYAVRLGAEDALAEFYARLGDRLKQRFAGWSAFILTADLNLPQRIRLKPARRTPLYNGAIECRLYEFRMVTGRVERRRAAGGGGAPAPG